MSAIWGAINLDGKEIPEDIKRKLKEGFDDCKIDRMEELSEKGCYMGCGIQYFTPESVYEKGPCVLQGHLYTTDVIIDNRDELLESLTEELSGQEFITDGEILINYVRKYGSKKLNNMNGAYCLVDYDKERKLVHILTDAVGYRSVYYYVSQNTIYFASLIKALEAVIERPRLNKSWIADFIMQDNLNMFTDCEKTQIQGVYRVAPAQYLTIGVGNVTKDIYWQPTQKRKKIKFKTDEEYKNAFLELYKTCVESVLRSNGETATLLSGGYDSTSVVSLALPELKSRGKKLYSFTSVPLAGIVENTKTSLVDESDLVRQSVEFFGGIEPEFLELPWLNPWFDYETLENVFEMPFKSSQNMQWLYESLKQAYDKDARMMLSGFFGNGTVSFDNLMVYMAWLVKTGRWLTLYHEINAFHNMYHFTRKSILLTSIKDAFHINRDDISETDLFHDSFAKKDFCKKYGNMNYLWKNARLLAFGRRNYKAYAQSFITQDIFRHYGEFEQNMSLKAGIIFRDPTRDKRMVDFVSALPYDQFTKDGKTRRLIREYMSDYMPAHIIEERRKGSQSSDMRFRMIAQEDRIKEDWIIIVERNQDSEVIDTKKLLDAIENNRFESLSDYEIMRLIYTVALLRYMEKFKDE